MIIPQITHLIPWQQQPIIPLPTPPLPIFHPNTQHKPRHQQSRHSQHRDHCDKTRPIQRGILNRKDETSDDATAVAETDLQPNGDSGFVFPANVIGEYSPEEGEGNVGAGFDEVEGCVPGAFRDVLLAEKDDEAGESG